MATEHPLFLYRHLDRSKRREDSPRFRHRVAAAFSTLYGEAGADYVKEVKAKAGLIVSYNGFYDWDGFWTTKPIDEIVTAITIIYLRARSRAHRPASDFRNAVDQALRDEHIGLRIDGDGSFHFAVDENFEVVHQATLNALDDPRLVTARSAYEQAHKFMDQQPPETLLAVKAAFEAVEVVATQLAPAHKNLYAKLCKGDLKAICMPALTIDPTEIEVLGKLFDSMGEWVDGIHFYRHRKWHTAPPSIDTTVLALTTASAYLRLLGGVAVKILPNG